MGLFDPCVCVCMYVCVCVCVSVCGGHTFPKGICLKVNVIV